MSNNLEDLHVLIQESLRLKKEIKETEDLVKEKASRKRQIDEHDLPVAAIAKGLNKYETADGIAVKHDLKYRGSTSNDRIDAIISKVGEYDLASGFKKYYVVTIPHNPDGTVEDAKVLKAFQEYNIDYETKVDIHYQTLGKLVSDLMDLFEDKEFESEEAKTAELDLLTEILKIDEYYKTTIKETK